MREQAVLRILGAHRRRGFRGLTIRRRGDDEFLHLLHVPIHADELSGQPVEEFGMRRLVALRAKIFRRLHQAGAEVLLPEAIHRHACGQRVRRIDQPAREAEAIGGRAGGQGREEGGKTGLHLVALLVVFTADEHEGVARLLHFLRDHRGGNGLVDGLVFLTAFVHFSEDGLELRRMLAAIKSLHLCLLCRVELRRGREDHGDVRGRRLRVAEIAVEGEIRRTLDGHRLEEELVRALFQIDRDPVNTIACFFVGAFSHQLVVDPKLEGIIRAQAQFQLPCSGNLEHAMQVIGTVDAVEILHQQVGLLVSKVRLGRPLNFIADARVSFLQVNSLLRLEDVGEAVLKILGLERADDLPRLGLGRIEQANQIVILRRRDAEMSDGPL